MKPSKLFTLKIRDILYAALITAGTSFGLAVMNSLQLGKFPTISELLVDLKISAIAGLVYLLKNIFSNSKSVLGAKEPNSDITSNGYSNNSVQSAEKN